nr:unnamed protein product [Callosobruchus chinensis]
MDGEEVENFKVPTSDLNYYTRKKLRTNWQDHYLNCHTGKTYKIIQRSIRNHKWFDKEINKNYIRVLSRLRSGHTLVPQHQAKIGLSENPLCRCGEVGTLEHCLLECPYKTNEATQMYYMLSKFITLSTCVSLILGSENKIFYAMLYNYCMQLKILI